MPRMITNTPYHITFNNLEHIEEDVRGLKFSKIVILVDENTKEYCLPILEKHLSIPYCVIEIQSGEQHKTIDTCRQIWTRMAALKMDRHSILLNLGGGVIGDMGGFCAATYMRGISFIQIPTTLLAQVDASIGGKIGIDLNHHKNMIGAFVNPQSVYIDSKFLDSLPYRQMRSGYAEVIKHALIYDKNHWEELVNKLFDAG